MALLTTQHKTARPQTTRMRSAIITAPRTARLRQAAIPEPLPHQVRVRLEGCGVCASNVPVWEGRDWFEYPRPPGSPGHEGWGHVDAVGEAVDSLMPGDRVGLLSQHAFAEFDMADASCLVKLPPELQDIPFPAEPLACAVNAFRRSGIHAGECVAVVGAGFLGNVLIQLARSAGARVFAVSRRQSALDLAADCGAEAVFSMNDPGRVLADIQDLTQGEGCECVIECTGYQQPLDLASELVRVRGRLVIAGYHQDGWRQVNLQSWNWRGIDVVNAHERQEEIYVRGMQEAVELVSSGALDFQSLLTHQFPLAELADALETARLRPEGFIKAIVRMD